MAHERGQADLEAGRSMRSWGWLAYKKRDATRCPRCGEKVLPGAASGTWDFPNVGIPLWDARKTIFIDVEVKAANTSLPFSELQENQHLWAAENPERSKWLWIGLGKNAVNALVEPRKTYFLPYETFLFLESALSDARKSLPYDLVDLQKYELVWEGNKIWGLPLHHIASVLYKEGWRQPR